jgi:hypothetical protein
VDWQDRHGLSKVLLKRLHSVSPNVTGGALGQARDLYGDPTAVKDVLALRSAQWLVEPNFHWGFMSTGYAWSKTSATLEEYCEFWLMNT